MHRIDSDGHVGNLYDEGDPGVPRLPTMFDADAMNALQEELMNILDLCSVAGVKGTWNQLAGVLVNTVTNQTIAGIKTLSGRLIQSLSSALAAASFENTGAGSAVYATSAGAAAATLDLSNSAAGQVASMVNSSGAQPTLRVRNNNGSMSGNAIDVEVGQIKLSNSNPASADGHTNQLSALGLEKGWAHFAWSNGAPTLSSGMNMAAPGNPAAGQIQINMTAGIGTGAMVVTGIAGAASYIVVPKNLLGLIEIQDLTGTPVAFGSTTGFAFVRITGRQ